MVEIAVFEQKLGVEASPSRVDQVRETFDTRTSAADWIKEHISQYEIHGYNQERDYWWCRSAEHPINTIFRIDNALNEIVSGATHALETRRW